MTDATVPRAVERSEPARRWFVAVVVAASAALLAAALVPVTGPAGTVVDAFRSGIAVVYGGVLPGALVLALFGVSLRRAEALVYAVVVSVAVLSAAFATASLAYLAWPWPGPAPLSEPFVLGATVAIVGALTGALVVVRPGTPLPTRECLADVRPSVGVAAVALPTLAALGAAVMTVDGPNEYALGALVAIAAVPLVATAGRLSRSEEVLVCYATALALLLQNTVMTEFLKSGDANYEFYFSNRALADGVWTPGLAVNKNAMLRLTVLHPVHKQLTGLPLELEYRLVHPFLFAVVAIGVYVLYDRYFGRRTTLLSTMLFCFLHPFFSRYSLDTRTAFGLLGVLVVVLAATDRDLGHAGRAVVAVTTVFVVVTSFYGTGVVIIILVGMAVVYARLWGTDERVQPVVSVPTALLTVVLTYLWYSRFAGGETLEVIVEVSADTALKLLRGDFTFADSAAGAAAADTFSLTYSVIRAEIVVLTLLFGFGALVVTLGYPPLNRVLPRFVARPLAALRADIGTRHPVATDSRFYVAVTFAALAFLASAFAPTTILGVERSYMIAGAFLFPYAFVLFDAVAVAVRRATGWSGPAGRDGESRRTVVFGVVIPAVLAGLLLVNAGVMAATVTEERSTQPLLDRERTVEDGTPPEVFHLYAHYTPPADVDAAGWLHDHRTADVTVYGSEATDPYPSYFFYTEPSTKRPPGPFSALERRQVRSGGGYVFVDEYSTHTGAINYRVGEQRFANTRFVPLEDTVVADSARIYSADETAVYLDRSERRPATGPVGHLDVTAAAPAGEPTTQPVVAPTR